MGDVIDINEPDKPKRGRGAGGPLDFDGLTGKQRLFAINVAGGMPLADAYRRAYDTRNMKSSTVWREAHALSIHIKVAPVIARLVAKRDKLAEHEPARIRAFVLERLQKEALEADSASARVQALSLLGKVDRVSLFREHVVNEEQDNREAAELRAALAEKLDKLA